MPINRRGYRRARPARYVRPALFFAVIALAASFLILMVLNGNAAEQARQDAQARASAAQTPAPAQTPAQTPAPAPGYAQKIAGVPADAEMYFSFDGRYCAYMDGGALTVRETASGAQAAAVAGEGLVWAQFLDERDALLYLTLQGEALSVNNCNAGNGRDTRQLSIKLPGDAKVKAADVSCARGYLCVNVRTGTKFFYDEVYSVDIMKRTVRLNLQETINDMAVAERTRAVYYTNGSGYLYCGEKALSGKEEGTLLGIDAKDKVYFQKAADKSTVFVFEGEEKTAELQLPNIANILRFYKTPKSVYAVYDGYLLDITGDLTKRFEYDKSMGFMGIGGNSVFLRGADGDVIGFDLA